MSEDKEEPSVSGDKKSKSTRRGKKRKIAVARRRLCGGKDELLLKRIGLLESYIKQLNIETEFNREDGDETDTESDTKRRQIEYIPIKLAKFVELDLGEVSDELRHQVGQLIEEIDVAFEEWKKESKQLAAVYYHPGVGTDTLGDVNELISDIDEFVSQNKVAKMQKTNMKMLQCRRLRELKKRRKMRRVSFDVVTQVNHFRKDIGEIDIPSMIVP